MNPNMSAPDNATGGLSATYSPEDNKLRLYAAARLSPELYARVKAAGFKWAPKQELFVAPAWTPEREDLLLELCGDIGDEDYSPEERAADRAERFAGYRDKRANEAEGRADTFEAGPDVFGHQNRARAERQAMRHDRHRLHAVNQWGKAEYWQQRTQAVISHALHKSSAAVRRSRLLRLESEQRKHEKGRQEYAKRFSAWSRVTGLEGASEPVPMNADGYTINGENAMPAGRLAYLLASVRCWGDYTHPRTGRKASLHSLLSDAADPITPAEAAALWLAGKPAPDAPDTYAARWSAHYELRIGYEKAMLQAEGGMAAEADIEPGGWIGRHQVHAVNRSPATGRVVSVKIMAEAPYYRGEMVTRPDGTFGPPLVLQSINIERLGADAYRPPTDEERAAFKAEQAKRKAEAKARKPAAPALVNPTDEDAERIQAAWNEAERAKHAAYLAKNPCAADFEPSEVLRMTQAKYSELSKGAYSRFETRTYHACGRLARRHTSMYSTEGQAYDKSLGAVVCKLRIYSGGGYFAAPRVVVLTDKPRKPIPAPVAAEQESEPVLAY